jgi:hypothetical protein
MPCPGAGHDEERVEISSRSPDLVSSCLRLVHVFLRSSKKNRCAVVLRYEQYDQLSALLAIIIVRAFADEAGKQAIKQASKQQQQQRQRQRQRQERRVQRKIGERFYLAEDPPRKRAAFAMRAAENYSSEPDLRMLQLLQARKARG